MLKCNGDTLPSEVWTGKKKEHRKSNRRKTFAPVAFIGESTKKITSLNGNDQPCALDLSLDGAFIKNRTIPHLGEHINLKIDLPMKKGMEFGTFSTNKAMLSPADRNSEPKKRNAKSLGCSTLIIFADSKAIDMSGLTRRFLV